MHVGILQSLGRFVQSRCTAQAQAEYARLVPAGEVLAFREVPDERVQAVVASLAEAERKTPAQLLAAYGRYWASTAKASYPNAYAAPGAKAFLLAFGGVHRAARSLPGSHPPEIVVSERSPGELVLSYTSSRRMCGLVRGMVEGVAESYGERVRIAERECMLSGHAQCTFEVELGAGQAARGS